MSETYLLMERICLLVILGCALCLIPLLISLVKGIKKAKKITLPHHEVKTKFVVIIPARDESAVIEDNLRAIENDGYPKDLYEVYIIVESKDDKTIEIAKKYSNTNIYIKQHLNAIGKGHTLDECFKYLLSIGKEYDACLFLDADNVISEGYMARLNDAYQEGYDMAVGRRDNKDWNSSVVSSSSALTFNFINELINLPNTGLKRPVIICGTGFYITYKVVKELGGWPFFTLTEDHQFNGYVKSHGLKTIYLDDIVFKDEQPTKLKTSIVQRSRWVKGFFQVSKLEKFKASFTSFAIFIMIFAAIFYLFETILFAVFDVANLFTYLQRLGISLFIIYWVLFLATVIIFASSRKRLDISKKNMIKTTFYHPIFLATYVAAAVRAIFLKNTWEKIEHGETKKEDKA